MASDTDKLTVVGIYPWSRFWAMAEGQGSPSFYLSPKGFVDAGHRMVIVTPRGEFAPGESLYHGIEVVRYRGGPPTILENPSRCRFSRFFIRNFRYWQYQVAALVAGYRVCRRVEPDALIAYGDHSTPATWVLGKLFGVPTINRLFGTFLNRFVGQPLKMYYHYIQVLGMTVPSAYVVLVDDGSQGDVVARALGVPDVRLRFWRNGVNPSLRDPEADPGELRAGLGLPTTGPLLFTVSRLHPEKHVERILRALPRVRERYPDVRFVVIGDGPERDALEEEAHRLGVSDLVIFAGAVDQESLGRYLGACDVFVAMSDRTNAANPLFEAMLCARPAVVLDTGGTGDAIEDGVTGWLVPEDRPDELAPILIRVLEDPLARERVGTAALAWAQDHIPTWAKRQEMEVGIVEQAVREAARRKRHS